MSLEKACVFIIQVLIQWTIRGPLSLPAISFPKSVGCVNWRPTSCVSGISKLIVLQFFLAGLIRLAWVMWKNSSDAWVNFEFEWLLKKLYGCWGMFINSISYRLCIRINTINTKYMESKIWLNLLHSQTKKKIALLAKYSACDQKLRARIPGRIEGKVRSWNEFIRLEKKIPENLP